ncbi:AAA family ATPase [Fictibacillus halophilus]|uniref:AAA family ATPase n=1 Tax=Fictibacillus halophilus TaxID=1610490 RepID=UPI00362CBC56
MNKLRIKNLRSLVDTGEIELKPLTVLVGKNSSGKSTFLRYFPLMKQTLETRTNEPILWYSRFVDFGSYNESLNSKNKNGMMSFEFEFTLPESVFYREVLRRYYIRPIAREMIDSNNNLCFNLKIFFSEKIIEKIIINFEDHVIKIDIKNKEKTMIVNINESEKELNIFSPHYSIGSVNFLPNLLLKESFNMGHTEQFFKTNLIKKIQKLANNRTGENTIEQVINNFLIGSSNKIFKSIKCQEPQAQKLKRNLHKIEIDDSVFREIKHDLIGMYLNPIINVCNRYLELNFSNVKYIAPLRASAERYYRYQGLSVDELDPQGTNLTMMLNNMTNKEKQIFNAWIKSNFGFELHTFTQGGHTSLKIKFDDNTDLINLADTGFGYSQVLPIILVLWKASQNNIKNSRHRHPIGLREAYYNSTLTVVIEQPELHLHPALQAKLMDAFLLLIMISKKEGLDLKIIIETHSETMLNRIGYQIAKNKYKFNNDFVNILIFNKVDTYESQIESTSYTSSGKLASWPIGFFSPEDC